MSLTTPEIIRRLQRKLYLNAKDYTAPLGAETESLASIMSQGVSMKRRKIDPETKMAAVLEGLRGESSIADICRKYQISESLYYR